MYDDQFDTDRVTSPIWVEVFVTTQGFWEAVS